MFNCFHPIEIHTHYLLKLTSLLIIYKAQSVEPSLYFPSQQQENRRQFKAWNSINIFIIHCFLFSTLAPPPLFSGFHSHSTPHYCHLLLLSIIFHRNTQQALHKIQRRTFPNIFSHPMHANLKPEWDTTTCSLEPIKSQLKNKIKRKWNPDICEINCCHPHLGLHFVKN